jgi:uncharacterized repeat protein (TIGR03803 family)
MSDNHVRAGNAVRPGLVATAVVWGLVLAITVAPTAADAQSQFNVIHTFVGGSDGEYPEAGLTQAPKGSTLYGTTFGAIGKPAPAAKHCSKGCGNEFSINPQYTLTNDYSFKGGADGAFPTGELVFDSSNNLYGTTEFGGETACNGLGCGTAFVLAKGADQYDKVFKFCVGTEFPGCPNGALPRGGPTMENDGYLYGTTSLGGTGDALECDNDFGGCGTVYRLTTPLLKKETVLYSFCQVPPNCQDGAIPLGKVLEDSSGNFFGTTQFGGAYGAGVIYELQPGSHGKYTETVLYSFCAQAVCADGAIPEAGLIADTYAGGGKLYGTASAGGGGSCQGSAPGCGVVFELTPGSNGYSYTVAYTFAGDADGALPQAPLVQDPTNGNLYGTTQKGGAGAQCNASVGCGTVFMLTPDGTEAILKAFNTNKADGALPEGALLLDNGLLYGATRVEGDVGSKGACDCGTLFTISTQPVRGWGTMRR